MISIPDRYLDCGEPPDFDELVAIAREGVADGSGDGFAFPGEEAEALCRTVFDDLSRRGLLPVQRLEAWILGRSLAASVMKISIDDFMGMLDIPPGRGFGYADFPLVVRARMRCAARAVANPEPCGSEAC